MHKTNPEIVKAASLIGRTPSSLAMKLVNFASLDPAVTSTGRKGLGNASAADKKIWEEMHADWDRLAEEGAKLLTTVPDQTELVDDSPESFATDGKRTWVEVRVRQAFFRNSVLSSYLGRCCMSGITEPALLNASHIVPWKVDRNNRLNPRNGLCLSVLHDRAFDRGLITVGPDLRIKLSKKLKDSGSNPTVQASFLALEGQEIALPEKFVPDPNFLEYHLMHVFRDNR